MVATVARELGYATALVRSRILDPLDGAALAPFEIDDGGDPAQFVDAVCTRLNRCREQDRQRERDRSHQRRDTTPAVAPDIQSNLTDW